MGAASGAGSRLLRGAGVRGCPGGRSAAARFAIGAASSAGGTSPRRPRQAAGPARGGHLSPLRWPQGCRPSGRCASGRGRSAGDARGEGRPAARAGGPHGARSRQRPEHAAGRCLRTEAGSARHPTLALAPVRPVAGPYPPGRDFWRSGPAGHPAGGGFAGGFGQACGLGGLHPPAQPRRPSPAPGWSGALRFPEAAIVIPRCAGVVWRRQPPGHGAHGIRSSAAWPGKARGHSARGRRPHPPIGRHRPQDQPARGGPSSPCRARIAMLRQARRPRQRPLVATRQTARTRIAPRVAPMRPAVSPSR